MALADSVPGVSGGTIAFILGFYDDFVNSLNALISVNKTDRLKAFKFLYKIGVGWIVGFLMSAMFITSIFEKNIYEINSLFLGFIIASIPIIVKSEKKNLLENKKGIIFLIIGAIIVFTMTYFNPISGSSNNFVIKLNSLNIGFIVYIFLTGMIAISAMVLPGISGSTILLIFGLYAPILGSIKQVLKLNFEYLPIIIIFICGILVGILISVRIVRYMLKKFRTETMYCIIGLMIGSIYSVIMGPTSLEIPKSPISMDTFNIIFFVIGCILVPYLEKIKDAIN
ncbi:DUF368 domain-containing protein [Paraclostridium sordellii]|uniref:DUF368 domain-containing protein n=1 Tax=Paraclostridium sordellii TaxID=1505 RepID=UPI0006DCFFA0|nr:DUF368 domain-containing protein [Paeniclostridium sordellii]